VSRNSDSKTLRLTKNSRHFRFLTSKQLEDEVRNRFSEAEKALQMPPVIKPIEDQSKVYSHDQALSNFSKHTYVFSDVTFGLKNKDRSVVVREPDGALKEASYDIKKRVWQIYFPLKDRTFTEPKIFEEDNFKRLLSEEQYQFLLDRACLQYEPEEQQFHDISSRVYLHINEHMHFESLRSTRHFGPMAFFLAWHKIIDNLLLDMVRNDYMRNAVELICVFYKINNCKENVDILSRCIKTESIEKKIQNTVSDLLKKESVLQQIDKSDDELRDDEAYIEFVQKYVEKYSQKKPQLELALQTYKEWHNELKNIQLKYSVG
jgi:small subunit ribosomal protein S22